jgi:SagB-type dehydrogenase family enzyme
VDGCTVMRRAARDVAVHAEHPLVWGLLAAMDGRTAWRGIREDLVDPERGIVQGVTSALVAAGAVDLSGRALGRFLHWATRKGVAPAGGLEGDEALRLASDGETGRAAGRVRLPMSAAVPAPLREFHALTRARRSIRDYRGTAIPRDQLDALIGTACGVTGALRWPGGEVKLRAYPSSGALYAVGVYPVALRVEDLDSSVLRLDADAGALEVIGPTDPAHWIAAALPMERELVAGLSLLVCLTGRFDRHERKYGEGGYRMLVAEAGHVSHNLVLAATALGLAARPFGGMFDALVNDALGLDEATEQFLLAVAVGHAG